MFNTQIIGNLGCNAEKKTIKERDYVSLRVSLTIREKDEDGKYIDKTHWVDVLYRFNEKLFPYLTKGSVVYVQGALSFRAGTEKHAGSVFLSMIADDLQLAHSTKAKEVF